MNAQRRRRGAVVLVRAAVLVCLVSVALAFLTPSTQTSAQREHDVARQLKCPTCVAESVADSSAPVAEAMRAVISERVDAGDEPDVILAWFADTYGQGVLLDPFPTGWGLFAWAVPVVLIAASAFGFARSRRWSWGGVFGLVAVVALFVPAASPGDRLHDPTSSEIDTVSILSAASAASPADAELRSNLASALSEAGRVAEAVEHHAAAYRLKTDDALVAGEYAAALALTGDEALALAVLERALEAPPGDARAVLLLGVLLSDRGEPEGTAFLQRYVAENPDAPLAASVRERLDATRSPSPSSSLSPAAPDGGFFSED